MSHGVTAVALSAGQRSVGCSSVQVLMLSGLLLLLIAIASPLSTGPGRDRDTNVRERDGSGTHTSGSGTGTGELLAGTGGRGMA